MAKSRFSIAPHSHLMAACIVDFEQLYHSLFKQCLQYYFSRTLILYLPLHECHCFLLSGAFELAFEPYKPYSWSC